MIEAVCFCLINKLLTGTCSTAIINSDHALFRQTLSNAQQTFTKLKWLNHRILSSFCFISLISGSNFGLPVKCVYNRLWWPCFLWWLRMFCPSQATSWQFRDCKNLSLRRTSHRFLSRYILSFEKTSPANKVFWQETHERRFLITPNFTTLYLESSNIKILQCFKTRL